jgi:hypothetical protein
MPFTPVTPRRLAFLIVPLAIAAPSLALDHGTDARTPHIALGDHSLMLRQDAAATGAPASGETPADQSAASADLAPSAAPAFGEAGSWSWSVVGAAAFTSGAQEYGTRLTFGTFLADNFEITFGVAGWYHRQDGNDAGSGNPLFGFRYHFSPPKTFNPYIEVGIGLLFSSDDVPEDGTSINFTPRAGAGVLIRLGESQTRLDLGIGWHHISNASTEGSDDNPSRDSVAIYAGLVVPF